MAIAFDALVDLAARPYADAGRYAYHFARGKLRRDPVFRHLLAGGLLPARGRLLDLGCGLGVLPALLAAARREHAGGRWIANWPAPPHELELQGVELLGWKVAAGRIALADAAAITQGDIRDCPLPSCSAAVILDVLLYLAEHEQRAVLARVIEALEPGGVLVVREADAAAGWRFQTTWRAEQVCCLARGQGWPVLHYRSAGQWLALLGELGCRAEPRPMSAGTPFANVLYVAHKGG